MTTAHTAPPLLAPAVLQTPRPARPRMSPGPSSTSPFPISSPRQGSPRGSDARHVGGMDVEAAVRAHGGDVDKALEAAINERNSLQQQNTQLWKLIEKQRAQSAQLVQDNDRLRSDRERANQRLSAAGLEPVSSKRITNSASAVGLGLKAETPVIRRHNSDRDDKLRSPANMLEVPSVSATSSAHSSPAEPQTGLLPSPIPDKASRRESRMAFAPEVRSYLSLAESPVAARHNIPPVPIMPPAPPPEADVQDAAPSTSLSSVQEMVDEPIELPEETPPIDKPADPRVVLSRPLETPPPTVERQQSGDAPPTRPSIERPLGDHSNPQLPRLSAALLPHTRLAVPHTTVYPNSVGRDVLCFIVSVSVRPPASQPVTWNVAKLFSAFIDLDARIKAKSGMRSKELKAVVAPLPDGKTWKDFAPSKIDQRKGALEAYLQSLLVAPLSDKTGLCHFLSTNPVQSKTGSSRKEGYLTKRVKGLGGGWKTRYFVLDGPSLDCYEGRGGPKHSSIHVTGAQIGRQNRASEMNEDRESRHAFLIIEQTKKGPQRHILCAESDMDRDSWIEALVRQVDPDAAQAQPPTRRRSDSRRSGKEMVVTAAQPLANLAPAGDSKFAGAPSPSLFNSMESQRIAGSSPSLVSHSSQGSVPQVPSVGASSSMSTSISSPLAEHAASLPDPAKMPKRQSMLPARSGGPPPAHTAAYLSKLSSEGYNAPPGTDKDRDRKAKSGRFWPSFGKTQEKVSRPVFGVPLADSIAIASIANLPAIVFRSIEYLEAKHAEQEEGIYRLSGSSAVIKGLKDRFDVEGDINLKQIDERWDPHAIAGLLKSFLRELPTSLLTRDLHAKFLAVMDLIDPSARVAELARLVGDLPPPNYALLRALTAHLILVVKNAAVNKMTLRNIGIVFSPTLGIPAGIFSDLVSHFGPIFDDEEFAAPHDATHDAVRGMGAVPEVEEPDSTVGRKRNSMLYQQGGADAMLGLGGRALEPVDDSASDQGSTPEDHEHDHEQGESDHFSAPSSETHSAADHGQVDTTPRAEAYASPMVNSGPTMHAQLAPVDMAQRVPARHPARSDSLPPRQSSMDAVHGQ